MTGPSRSATARAVLERYPRSYAEELGIRDPDTPSGVFRILVMALLMGARIRAGVALEAARALSRQRWNTPRSMAAATWGERTHVINRAGYARYDERTSRMLGETSEMILDRYGGDLRRLRETAERDPRQERRLVREFPGIGDVSADIFFREIQGVWDEVAPFADRKVLGVARRFGLGGDPRALARVVDRDDFVRLVDGLVRSDLDKTVDDTREGPAGR